MFALDRAAAWFRIHGGGRELSWRDVETGPNSTRYEATLDGEVIAVAADVLERDRAVERALAERGYDTEVMHAWMHPTPYTHEWPEHLRPHVEAGLAYWGEVERKILEEYRRRRGIPQ